MEEIINRVAKSPLISLDLEDYYSHQERLVYDLKDNLFMGMILKEKDFREFIKTHNWTQYTNKNVAITCSEDAIIPTWAYMLLATNIAPYADLIVFGTLQELENQLFFNAINTIDIEAFRDKKVVVKGCSKLPVPTTAYVEITRKLQPVVQSLMFGEPCSTVPIYKRK